MYKPSILIIRCLGGLGDLLNQRPILRQLASYGVDVTFACPAAYMEVVADCGVRVVEWSERLSTAGYDLVCDISDACRMVEQRVGFDAAPHRSVIWAEWMGLRLDPGVGMGLEGVQAVGVGDKPSMCLCPFAHGKGKSLDASQVRYLVDGCKDRYSAFVLHWEEVEGLGCPVVRAGSHAEWLGRIAGADLVVAVDTAAFHAAQGMGRPLVGVFMRTSPLPYQRQGVRCVRLAEGMDAVLGAVREAGGL